MEDKHCILRFVSELLRKITITDLIIIDIAIKALLKLIDQMDSLD